MTIILALLIIPLVLSAQQSGPVATPQPNCVATDLLPEAGQTVAPFNMSRPFDNRIVGCTDFTLTVEVPTTISALSLVLQTAPDNGSGVPGTWSTFTAVTGANPNTLTTGWQATFSSGTSAYFAWLRVQLTSVTGTGQVRVKFRSSIAGSGNGSGSGGCVGTPATPCVVDGPTAAGMPVTTPPVQMGGIDAFGNVQEVLLNDSDGALLPAGGPYLGADAQPNAANTFFSSAGLSYFLTRPNIFNGTAWDRQFSCTNRANITLTTIGLTRIITGSASKKIRLCSLSMSFASPVDVQVVEGTQAVTACDTGATNMTGLYRSVVGFDPNLSNLFALTEGTAADDVCISMSASVNGGGTAIYAVF